MDWMIFISNFVFISLLPGINMTLALNFGINLGYKRTIYMMIGQILSLGIVASLCVSGLGFIVINRPSFFVFIKFVGGIYIVFLAIKLFISTSRMIKTNQNYSLGKKELFLQGLIASISNPKAWIFLATLLPPFVDVQNPFGLRSFMLVFVIMMIEFFSLSLYAFGGVLIWKFMSKYMRIFEIISALLLFSIGAYMIFGAVSSFNCF